MAKKLSTEEKMAIILEGLRREKSVSHLQGTWDFSSSVLQMA